MKERCSNPINEIRHNAYFSIIGSLQRGLRTSGPELEKAIHEEFTEEEIRQQHVAPERIRGRERADGGFDPPRCDGEIHSYEVLAIGRWCKSSGICSREMIRREEEKKTATARPKGSSYLDAD